MSFGVWVSSDCDGDKLTMTASANFPFYFKDVRLR